MYVPPTIAQQRAIGYAPIPFATISFVSSSYVIHHLIFQESHKLKRLYHRLVLAMNFALLPLSFSNIWSTLAVPEGTPYYAGAMGTVNTCTSQGFLKMMFGFTVPTYYASLVLQALMGIRNNFKEENYRWIEIPIHLVAYCIPFTYAIASAVTENLNPSGSGCWYAKAPRGCESDPDVACQRGQDIKYLAEIVGFSTIFLYYIFPTLVVLAIGFWMKKTRKDGRNMRENARKEMMHSVHLQISVYLFLFWSTNVLVMISGIHQVLTGDLIYNFFIPANCIFALQGFVFMLVYFTLQKMGRRRKTEYLNRSTLSLTIPRHGLTVSDIRSNAQRRMEDPVEDAVSSSEQDFDFNIFDGSPDPDSPWAKFFDQGNASDDECAPDEEAKGGTQPPLNEKIELADDQRISD